jgi:hypothetical protein
VAAIFRVPTATAKRLVNAAVARYAVESSRKDSAGRSKTSWTRQPGTRSTNDGGSGLPTTFIRDRILEVASRQPVPDPTRPAGSLCRFPDETYQAVREGFGLEVRKEP